MQDHVNPDAYDGVIYCTETAVCAALLPKKRVREPTNKTHKQSRPVQSPPSTIHFPHQPVLTLVMAKGKEWNIQ